MKSKVFLTLGGRVTGHTGEISFFFFIDSRPKYFLKKFRERILRAFMVERFFLLYAMVSLAVVQINPFSFGPEWRWLEITTFVFAKQSSESLSMSELIGHMKNIRELNRGWRISTVLWALKFYYSFGSLFKMKRI